MASNGSSENSTLSPIDIIQTGTGAIQQTIEVKKVIYSTTDDSNHTSPGLQTGTWADSSFENSDLASVSIKQIKLMGDFNSSNEYLGSVIIGGHNFGNLSSDHQNQTYYNVFNGNQLVEKNASNHIEYDLFASANVNDAGGYYSYKIEITFEVLVQIEGEDVETAFTDFTFFSGRDACDSIAQPNTELYYLSDEDLRPSLGLFALKDFNSSETNFDANITGFNQSNLTFSNKISNGSGRLVTDYNYKQNSLGLN